MTQSAWQPLRLLRELFEANVASLRSRDPSLAEQLRAVQPAAEYVIATVGENVRLAQVQNGAPVTLPNPVNSESARKIADKLFPTGKCTESVLVAGLDQGWLWKSLFEMPSNVPAFPGYTPPLYFLTRDVERLWCVLHLHDWRDLLSNSRARLFAGEDCVERAQQSMADNLAIPFPQLSVTVDPTIWNGATLDTMRAHALGTASSRITELQSQLDRIYGSLDVSALAQRLNSGKPLRVMGITSRYTTFLQYSMRDWLDAFEAIGHETHLLIEPEDCSLFNAITFSQACADFQPDLLLMIDRYRGEFSGMPSKIPWVMWVQDQLPHIFCDNAGKAQGELDYAIGYGRVDCVYGHKYPSDRFQPAMIPTNETRFVPRRLHPSEYEKFACDVSFISHCSTPADVLLQNEIERQSSPQAKIVLETIFEKLRGKYDAGESVSMPHEFNSMIDSTLNDLKLSTDHRAPLLNIFTHKINNALFRHQSLEWLAEMDLRVNLFGRGWENNPKFAKHAKGIADNQQDLSAIYQASRINLQVTPFGAAHQRVFDGLAAGGFFLLRFCEGDLAEPIYRDLWSFCRDRDIRSDAQLIEALPDSREAREWIDELTRINAQHPFGHQFDFVSELWIHASTGFTRNASTLWDEYSQVVFRSREDLHSRVKHFLNSDAQRSEIARSMRQRVLDCMTYKSVARNTLEFVKNDLNKQCNSKREEVRAIAA